MELTHSGDELRDSKLQEARSILTIDLNEIPSPSIPETLPDSIDIVRAYHENPPPPPGGPAGIPGEVRGSCCGACGKPEVRGHVVICDGCERGFHLGCAGMRGRQAVNLEEWVCGDCVSSGIKSKRWPLGVKSKQLLDINSSPPSDVDGEGVEELLDLRKHTLGDNSFGANPFGAPVTYSNLFYAGNGFGYQKGSVIVAQNVKVGFEDILNHTQTMAKSFGELDLNYHQGRHRNSNNTAIRLPSRNPSEIFLQALREFISERHGVLEEGWHVEFRQSMSSSELYAVYCAPDGKMFDSVHDVACYLGLRSNHYSMEPEIRNDKSVSTSEGSHLPKKRKSTRTVATNGFSENKGTYVGCYSKEPFSDGLNMDCASSCWNKVSDAGNKAGFQQADDGLPLQFEDFFLLSLGKVDCRPLYHDVNLICPIGYKSCWHDKITGSLFICEVLDGSDSGPVFKIKRCSCSEIPVPIGSVVLSVAKHGHFVSQTDIESDGKTLDDNVDLDDDGSVQMILSESIPPTENDMLNCLMSCSDEASDALATDKLQPVSGFVPVEAGNVLSGDSVLIDEIGEINVEECSSSSAWRTLSRKIVEVCSKIYRLKGTVKFFCKHVENDKSMLKWNLACNSYNIGFSSLAKFCGSPGLEDIPRIIQRDNQMHILTEVLTKWLEQDRFGLDMEFVQEILEGLPGVEGCIQYHSLNSRSNYTTSLTIGSGFLVVKMKVGLHSMEEDALQRLYMRSKKARLVEDLATIDRCLPTGKPIFSRLPCELASDVYQAWELIWRFHEILDLREPLRLGELEEELLNPWFDGPNVLEKFERESQDNEAIPLKNVDGSNGMSLSSSGNPGSSIAVENPHAFIQMETDVMKEVAQTKFASLTYHRCFGVALTKAHISLLRILISELQCKVAVLVDPNFDAGESRSKRGRKKDVDSVLPVKLARLNMLPINELTWPELARRYILAVLSMDGNLESVEITARESGKVFRCLQGDGGLLCGSLTGVAGMEADAQLFAEATKRIFGSLSKEGDVLTLEDEESEIGACEKVLVKDGNIPKWAQMLKPVRKLPTNVGTRIRKCVLDALAENPPEWARKILEHSISKEVYKGNASGPTKKAVLSLLAEVCDEGLQQKSNKARKKKISISISDIVMKQCRIVLRRAAAADDAKVFCNLLGRKLINSSDNDDEGLLGSPAMVSRPLDFRTIDLKVAAGAYGGSHEAFLEDVRELWNHIRIAYGDQVDLVELADKLSENFESLYEKEVNDNVRKFVKYAKLESLSGEMKKEIDEILASTREIPKAPWEEGVCKVCGIDRDDDSVLLCDTCDAEYHTYCLNPPLARIPEGNWYCPSCVVGKHMAQDQSKHEQVISQHKRKKYLGEVTSVCLDALSQLTTVMEEKEYWEYNVGERIFLLKFFCDELLNTALIRQHLEQCAELSAELHQKLRSLYVEWKSLKSKEDNLFAKAAKIDTCLPNGAGEDSVKEGLTNSPTNTSRCAAPPHTLNERTSCSSGLTDSQPPHENDKEKTGFNCIDKYLSVTNSDTDGHIMNSVDNQGQLNNASASVGSGCDTPSKPNEQSLTNCISQEINCSRFQQGQCSNVEIVGLHNSEHTNGVARNECEAYQLELSSIRNDISLLQDSITGVESQLLKLSVRRDFLGIDTIGHLYWASTTAAGYPRIIVDASVLMPNGNKVADGIDPMVKNSVLKGHAISGKDTLGVSNSSHPFIHKPNDTGDINSSCVSYETDSEIEKLIHWLKDSDPKERDLKESIMHWQRMRFQENSVTRTQSQEEHQLDSLTPRKIKETAISSGLVTKAATLLEKKYGPFIERDAINISKKQGRNGQLTDEKLYRCKCLEPIWPSRNHCLSCHRTFLNYIELEGHKGKCNSHMPAFEKNKDTAESLKGKGSMKCDTTQEEFRDETDVAGTSKSGSAEPSSKLIKFQNEDLMCPYNFEDISSKFVTKDSNKELVSEIGLIGSDGIPSFLPSMSPYLSDSALMLISQNHDIPDDGFNVSEKNVSYINIDGFSVCHENMSGSSFGRSSNVPSSKISEQGDRKSSFGSHASEKSGGCCCVVPLASLRPLVGKVSHIARQLRINLLDMDAALPEDALRSSKAQLERRWAWRAFVKSAGTIYEMVQATIIFEDMIKTEYLRNVWWYWSSLSAAARTSTLSSLALRIYSLDAAIVYERLSSSGVTDSSEPGPPTDQKVPAGPDGAEKAKASRKSNRKRKEPDG